MNSDDLARHLLPKNATKLERAAAAMLLERVGDIPTLIDAIWTPAGCPTPLLRFLAFAVSVDVWDEDWPESVKRDVIAAAPLVHRKKGTVMAIEAALKALGVRSRTTEWWQAVPSERRGTFTVRAYARTQLLPNEPILGANVQLQVLRQIQLVKPKSRSFSFQIGADFGAAVIVASGAAGSSFQRARITADRPSSFQTTAALSGAFAGAQFAHFAFNAAT